MSKLTNHQAFWWEKYKDALAPGYLEQLRVEYHSTRILSFSFTVIPGLLQTEAYARAVLCQIGEHILSKNFQENRVEVRMKRQRHLFDKEPRTHLHVLLDESALWRHVGGDQIFLDQLYHLTEIVKLPYIILQILPFSSEAIWPQFGALPFEIFTSDEKKMMSAERSFHDHDNTYNDVEIAYYTLLFNQLCDHALSEEDSSVFLRQRIAEIEAQIKNKNS